MAIQEGAKPEDAAKQWVAANPGRVKGLGVARLVRSGRCARATSTAFFLAEGWPESAGRPGNTGSRAVMKRYD